MTGNETGSTILHGLVDNPWPASLPQPKLSVWRKKETEDTFDGWEPVHSYWVTYSELAMPNGATIERSIFDYSEEEIIDYAGNWAEYGMDTSHYFLDGEDGETVLDFFVAWLDSTEMLPVYAVEEYPDGSWVIKLTSIPPADRKVVSG